jgi:hypothetical protein
MRLVLAIALLAAMAAIPVGAEEDPARAIQWNWTLEPQVAGADAELVLVAELAPHWVVYSSDFAAGVGPLLPARLRTKRRSTTALVGSLRSIGAHRKADVASAGEYGYFSKHVELRQRLKLPADGSPVELNLTGQACHETDGTCHPIRQDIRVATS